MMVPHEDGSGFVALLGQGTCPATLLLLSCGSTRCAFRTCNSGGCAVADPCNVMAAWCGQPALCFTLSLACFALPTVGCAQRAGAPYVCAVQCSISNPATPSRHLLH